MTNILDEISDNLLEKAIYDENDENFENGKVLFSDIQEELVKHRIDNTYENAVKPLMKWMSENQHPHTTAIVTGTRAELVEGLQCHVTDKFIVD